MARRDVGDLVEEERSAICKFKSADTIVTGVGESAFDMAKELALEGAFGESAGIDSNQRTAGPGGIAHAASARRLLCRSRALR